MFMSIFHLFAVATCEVTGAVRFFRWCRRGIERGQWSSSDERVWQSVVSCIASAPHVDRTDGLVTVSLADVFCTVPTTLPALAISVSIAHQ